ncbi:MAG: DNA alkylation repair protein [Flavobacteriales bacterium]|nr:DNA alkylation repair protein [Flavobacteriales bacterium]
MTHLKIPEAPNSIQKGVPLKLILDQDAVTQLATNLKFVYGEFDKQSFINESLSEIDTLGITERSKKIAKNLKKYLPNNYSEAINIILESLTPPLKSTENNGLAVLFYLPHVNYVAQYGLDKDYNNGRDPFEISMKAQFELTKRFSSEFSIRSFIIAQPERTFAILYKWMDDPDPHVRRLCSEGTRPRLPWAQKISLLVQDPSPTFPILEKLKNDDDLYVRRSVANHVGDIAKDNLDMALKMCNDWLTNSTKELNWVIRHALRHPAKKGNEAALKLRKIAK